MNLHLRLTAIVFCLSVVACVSVSIAHAADGINLEVVVYEILDADPPESAVIDSVSYPILYDRTTTFRAGNFVVDVTAHPGAEESVELTFALIVPGAVPFNRSDEATVAIGSGFVFDGIRGKGKSSYRALFVPHALDIEADTLAATGDSAKWEIVYSEHAQYFVPKGVLPTEQFLPVRSVLDYTLDLTMDSLGLNPAGRALVYLTPKDLGGWAIDRELGVGIDATRYRVIAYHTSLAPRIRPRDLILAAVYRNWGYAPALLASGVAGYTEFADFDVITDRNANHIIPLDSLVRTVDYNRHDRDVARHHAESFVTWLIVSYGVPNFRNLYDRATDLSLRRALWSVYGKTLAELEKEWLAYLKKRQFNREEFEFYARRDLAFRDFESHLNLLQKAADAVSPPAADILRDIGVAQGQLGRWDDAATSFKRLISEYPDNTDGRLFLAEAQRASGDDIAAWRTYVDLLRLRPTDPQAHLRMGDIQWETRRVDSAAVLWRKALANSQGRFTTAELCLRLGHYFSERRSGKDSSQAYFGRARGMVAQSLSDNPTLAPAWIITAESMLGQDSAAGAIEYLAVAELVTDAPIDVGRIYLLRGQCYDRLGRREEAVESYEAALSDAAEAPIKRLAQKYLNRPYGGRS